jgi:hypothetical protein
MKWFAFQALISSTGFLPFNSLGSTINIAIQTHLFEHNGTHPFFLASQKP